jgi:hypothetical protein
MQVESASRAKLGGDPGLEQSKRSGDAVRSSGKKRGSCGATHFAHDDCRLIPGGCQGQSAREFPLPNVALEGTSCQPSAHRGAR